MFTPEFFIDTFQGVKKTITNQIFKDATMNKAAHSYIDAQTQFAKVLVNNTIDMVRYSIDSVSTVVFPKEQASQAPYKVEKEAK